MKTIAELEAAVKAAEREYREAEYDRDCAEDAMREAGDALDAAEAELEMAEQEQEERYANQKDWLTGE